nr:MAG: carboxymuconolactone decarboxylase family protein [Hyphomicrobiales bacterium]
MDERYKLALETVAKVNGPGSDRIAEALQEIAPDFHRIIMSFGYGDIYSRPQLDLKSREIATIAALTAMANARPQLEAHIVGGLNVGLTREEIIEIIMQMSVYAGVPAALNGLMAALSAFKTFDEKTS